MERMNVACVFAGMFPGNLDVGLPRRGIQKRGVDTVGLNRESEERIGHAVAADRHARLAGPRCIRQTAAEYGRQAARNGWCSTHRCSVVQARHHWKRAAVQ